MALNSYNILKILFWKMSGSSHSIFPTFSFREQLVTYEVLCMPWLKKWTLGNDFCCICFSAVCFFSSVSFTAVVSAFWAFLSTRHSSALYCFCCIVSVLMNIIFVHSSCVRLSGCSDGPSRPRITRVHRNNSLLEQGELLRCESDGNPLPAYTWLDATTGERLHVGQELTFDACRHFSCGLECRQNNATVVVQCVATVQGQRWTNSVNTTATFFVDFHSYNATCSTNASSLHCV